MAVLLIDNYDSFTHNLYQLVGGLGADVVVVRNDALTVDEVIAMGPSHIVISPGPGHPANPRDFGVCGEVIERCAPATPTLGVCLGHQGLSHRLGASVVRAPNIVHGKTSAIEHDGRGVFEGIPSPATVMRYHSLAVDESTLPPDLQVSARTLDDGVVMAVRHTAWPLVGVQFHPESIGTPDGAAMMRNFLTMR